MFSRLVPLSLLAVAPVVLAERVLPKNIQTGKVVPDSSSPDGKYFLLDVFHSDTTQNSVIVATADRKQNLGPVPVHTEWSTDVPHNGRTTVLWSPDSKRFVVHDSFPKHSRAFIYRFTAAGFEPLATHDILAAACGHFGIKRDSVASSGQRPMKWPDGDLVHIEVGVRLKNGKKLSRTFPIHAPREGRAIQQ